MHLSRHDTCALLLVALFGTALAVPACAGVTITDQSQTGLQNQSFLFGPGNFFTSFGQSFTPTATSLNFVSLGFDFLGAGSTGSVEIFSGGGASGQLLGTSATTPLITYVFGDGSGSLTTFTFASPISLTPSQLYTIEFVPGGTAEGFIDANDGNPYAGGQAYLNGMPSDSAYGGQYSGTDLAFVEGTQSAPAAVPEPSSVASLGVGGLGLLGLILRARKRRTAA